MILGIDASNIRAGGGLTHLVEFLRAAEPLRQGFQKVVVWGGQGTLNRIEPRPWLQLSHQKALDKGLLTRSFWQRFRFSKLSRSAQCDVLFVPGGTYAGSFRPVVMMSQNLLPFEWRELFRYGVSWMFFKLLLLRWVQSSAFRRSDGTIYLTRYAKTVVKKTVGKTSGIDVIIPHGIDSKFDKYPREQFPIRKYSKSKPFRILYVSIIDMYKHQWNVAKAVKILREIGFPVHLELIGPAYPPALRRLEETLKNVDPSNEFAHYSGPVSHDELHSRYEQADLLVFASSCENMPIILLEGMASGLPIACSSRGPMPEVLGDAGGYFDPEDPASISKSIRILIESTELRARKAMGSYERAQQYTWKCCADKTLHFLAEIAEQKL